MWENTQGCRQAKKCLGPKPIYKWCKELMELPRSDAKIAVAWLTGHSMLNSHLWGAQRRECRFCKDATESVEHILWNCPAVEGKRQKYLGCPVYEMENNTPFRPSALVRYVKGLGLMSVGYRR